MSDLISRLSDWSSLSSPLAPLDQSQVSIVQQLAEQSRTRPRPAHIGHQSQKTRYVPRDAGADTCASDNGGLWTVFTQLEQGDQSMVTCQQYLQWLSQVEDSVAAEQSAPYNNFIEQLQSQLDTLSLVSVQAGDSLQLLDTLQTQYCSVSDKTVSLHEACQHLLEEQTQLAQLDRDLSERLSVFTTADKVAHKLTSPTLSVHSDTFLPLLATIDTNILYLVDHPTYKDSPAYLTKYRACLSRALDMVRSYIKRVLDTATAGAKQQETTSDQTSSAFTLFYGKFRAAAPKLRQLIEELETRGDSDQLPEYSSLLSDVQANYFHCRLELLGNSVRGAVSQLVTVHTRDHTGLLRAGTAFLLHVCEDEYQLFAQFFAVPDEEDNDNQLDDFLETLCLILYDNLRPLIIHITHLETLAELTSILRNEVVGQHCVQHPTLTAFKRVATQMLADVQERLVYRTSVYVRTDILGYSPAPGDLAYPEKLVMMEKIAESLKSEEKKGHSRQNSTSSVVSVTSMEVGNITSSGQSKYTGNSPADLHGMWYPPVRRTLLTLSKLYRCLEIPIFQSLSQEVLSACLQSISAAATTIGNNPTKTKSDGLLFEIKHLLILREQIAPFQVDFKVKETSLNFSQIKTAAVSLINHRSSILSLSSNNALLEFILNSAPGVQENLLDSRKDVDRRLKAVCEQFISETSQSMLGSVSQFNSKVSTFLAMRGDKAAKLVSQPWADTNIVTSHVAESIRLIKQNVPAIQRKMQIYLANSETEFILFRPIRSNILTVFVGLLSTLRTEYTLDQQTIIGCPTQEQLAAILASVMHVQVSRSSVSRLSVNSNNVSRQASLSPDNGDKKHSLREQSIEETETGDKTMEELKNNNLNNENATTIGVSKNENIV